MKHTRIIAAIVCLALFTALASAPAGAVALETLSEEQINTMVEIKGTVDAVKSIPGRMIVYYLHASVAVQCVILVALWVSIFFILKGLKKKYRGAVPSMRKSKRVSAKRNESRRRRNARFANEHRRRPRKPAPNNP